MQLHIVSYARQIARDTINYNGNSNYERFRFAQRCRERFHALFTFLSCNFLSGRPSHLPCFSEEARLREGEGLAERDTAVSVQSQQGAPQGEAGQRAHVVAVVTRRWLSSLPLLQTHAEDVGALSALTGLSTPYIPGALLASEDSGGAEGGLGGAARRGGGGCAGEAGHPARPASPSS